VLAPGRYTLSVAFTPADPGKYEPAQAKVEIVVEAPANIASGHAALEQTPLVLTAVAENDAAENGEQAAATWNTFPQNTHRETRTYKGAVYEKGEDGQWHLQQN